MAGQKNVKAISRANFGSAIGAVFVFDLTDLSPFNAIPKWLEGLQGNGVPNIYILVLIKFYGSDRIEHLYLGGSSMKRGAFPAHSN
jgi:hypothetical protein